MKKQILILLLKYGLGIGVLAWLIWSHWDIEKDGRQEGLSAIGEKPFQVPLFLAAACLLACSVFLTFVRWYLLVRAQDLPFRLSNAVRLGLVGYFTNTFLPGSVGGDVVKAAFVAREQSRRTVAVATVLVDRLVGLCALFWLTALVGGFFWATGQLESIAGSPTAARWLESVVWFTGVLTGASLAVWVVMGFLPLRWIAGIGGWLGRCPKIGGTLRELWHAVWLYRTKTRQIATCLALSMVGHFGFFTTYYLAARTVSPADDIPSWQAHLILVPVGTSFQAIIPTPGGIGGGEIGFGFLYQQMGYPESNGVWMSLVYRSLTWILGFIGYLIFLRMRAQLGQREVANIAENGELEAEAMRTVTDDKDVTVRPP